MVGLLAYPKIRSIIHDLDLQKRRFTSCSAAMEDPLMPSPRPSRFSHGLHNSTSNNDPVDASNTKFLGVDTKMEADTSTSVAYDTYNHPQPFDPCLHENGPLPRTSHSSTPGWCTTSESFSSVPFEFSPLNHPSYTYYQVEGESLGRRRLERLSWDDFQDHKIPEMFSSESSAMTRPRKFPQEVNTAMNAIHRQTAVHTQLRTSFHPSTPYFVGPPQQNSQLGLLSSDCRPDPARFAESTTVNTPRASTSYRSFQGASPNRSPLINLHDDHSAFSPEDSGEYADMDVSTIEQTRDEEHDGELNSEPYAQLIYRALKSAPEHRMVLKEIYEWFEKNTDKANDGSSKGWQNSIRHNLSMNGVSQVEPEATQAPRTSAKNIQAFKKVDQLPPSDDGKKGFMWVLEPAALIHGVESTTRYRKQAPHKKLGRTEPIGKLRQRCGARGGKATKKNAKLRLKIRRDIPRSTPQMEEAIEGPQAGLFGNHDNTINLDADAYEMSDVPYYLNTPSSTVQSSIADTMPYGFEDITGCASGLENEPIFSSSNYDKGYSGNNTDPMLADNPYGDADSHLDSGSDFSYFFHQ